jgi:hypothetical protein
MWTRSCMEWMVQRCRAGCASHKQRACMHADNESVVAGDVHFCCCVHAGCTVRMVCAHTRCVFTGGVCRTPGGWMTQQRCERRSMLAASKRVTAQLSWAQRQWLAVAVERSSVACCGRTHSPALCCAGLRLSALATICAAGYPVWWCNCTLLACLCIQQVAEHLKKQT